MAAYWLIPVQWNGDCALLGEDRLLLEPEEARIQFMEAFQTVHPRLLLSFKAELLLGDEALEACGTESLPFDLGQGQAIRLTTGEPQQEQPDQAGYLLSHCGEAYFNRLMTPQEASTLMPKVIPGKDTQRWVEAVREWLAQGRHVILLRGD